MHDFYEAYSDGSNSVRSRSKLTAVNMLLLIALWAPILPSTLEFEAESLHGTPDALRLDGAVKLSWPTGQLTAQSVDVSQSKECIGRTWAVRHSLLSIAPYELTMGEASYCDSNGQFTASDLRILAPQGTLVTSSAQGQYDDVDSGRLTLGSGWISPCNCPDPPWRVQFARASIESHCIRSRWPTLVIGSMPVMSVPRWTADWVTPYSGPLLPRVGWRQSTGWSTRFPFRWSLSETNALMLTVGQHGGSALGEARVQWKGPYAGLNSMTVSAADSDLRTDASLYENGFLGRLRLRSDWANTPRARRRLADDWRPLRTEWAHSYLGWSWTESTVALGTDVSLLQNIQSDAVFLAPRGWLSWSPHLGHWTTHLSARTDRHPVRRNPSADVNTLSSAIRIIRRGALGYLHTSLTIDGWHGHVLAQKDSSQQTVLNGAFDTGFIWQKAQKSRHHSIELKLDFRSETVNGKHSQKTPEIWRSLGVRHSIGAIHRQTWASPWSEGELMLRQGMNPLSESLDPAEMTVYGHISGLRVDAWVMGTVKQGATMDVEYGRSNWGLLAVRHTASTASSAPLWTAMNPQYRMPPRLAGVGLGPKFTAHLGPWTMNAWSLVNGQTLDVEGHGGDLAYSGRCACWFVRMHWTQDTRTQWSEVALRLGLGHGSLHRR